MVGPSTRVCTYLRGLRKVADHLGRRPLSNIDVLKLLYYGKAAAKRCSASPLVVHSLLWWQLVHFLRSGLSFTGFGVNIVAILMFRRHGLSSTVVCATLLAAVQLLIHIVELIAPMRSGVVAGLVGPGGSGFAGRPVSTGGRA